MGVLKEDLQRNYDVAGRWAVTLIRSGRRAPRILRPAFTFMLRLVCGLDFPLNIAAGPGLRLAHGGRGSVFHPGTTIGSNVTIYHGVTIGIAGRGRKGTPTIEDDVFIGAGACILGDVTIGRGAFIGANAVINRDVPPGVTMVAPRAVELQRA